MMNTAMHLRNILEQSKRTVFFGGAGVSTESGIPDFRSTDGLYNMQYDFPPETILSHSFFSTNPTEFYRFYSNKMIISDVQPNATHLWLAQQAIPVITQNIDGLHSVAISKINRTNTANYLTPVVDQIYELHGSVHRNYCTKCHHFYSLQELLELLELSSIPYCQRKQNEDTKSTCSGIIKPDVVLYEEGLDNQIVTQAVQLIRGADTLIIGGTSLTVYPAASLVYEFGGTNLILINRDATSADSQANLIIRQPLAQVAQQLIDFRTAPN